MNNGNSVTNPINRFDMALNIGKNAVAISDSEIQLLHSIPNKLEPIIKQICQDHSFPVKDIVPVGSSQRKTFLPGSRDIDIFIRFDTDQRSILESFADKIVPIIANRLETTYIIKYAENPFGVLQYRLKNQNKIINIDLVATIWINHEYDLKKILKLSGMARTPFHAFYLNKNIKGLEEEVRLFKYWAKKKKLYRQNGFTGFLSELLIIIFSSFHGVLLNANRIITLIHDFHKREPDELRKMFETFPIIITDPIDKDRNAAGGIHGVLGKLHLKRFVKLAHESISDPDQLWKDYELSDNIFSLKIFFKSEIIIKNDEEHYSRLGKIVGNLFKELRDNSIDLIDALIDINTGISLSTNVVGGSTLKRKGPPITLQMNVDKFKAHNKDVWIENGHIWTRFIQKTVLDVVKESLDKNKRIQSIDLVRH